MDFSQRFLRRINRPFVALTRAAEDAKEDFISISEREMLINTICEENIFYPKDGTHSIFPPLKGKYCRLPLRSQRLCG